MTSFQGYKLEDSFFFLSQREGLENDSQNNLVSSDPPRKVI